MLKILFLGLIISTQLWAKDVVIDVRTPEEFQSDHVSGAINLDIKDTDFKKSVSKLNRDDSYKVYCKSGTRSEKAIQVMRELGFKKLENLGGIDNAKKEIYVK